VIGDGLPGRRSAISTGVERSYAVMVDEGLSSEAEALELRLASVVDAGRARLLTIGEGHEQIGQLGVGAVRDDEPRDIVAPVPGAQLMASVGPRRSDRIIEPSRASLRKRLRRLQTKKPPAV
jgi:hypothetical protein